MKSGKTNKNCVTSENITLQPVLRIFCSRSYRTLVLMLAGGGLFTGGLCKAEDAIHAGPLYTAAASAQGSPVFPSVEVVIEVPPGTAPERLSPGNFSLQVDRGRETKATSVTSFASSGHGVAVSIAFDASGSMKGGPLNAIRTGLGRFVNDAGPQDRFAIETIADDTRWDSDWSDSRDHARAAISRLSSRGHLTRLWDGLLEGMRRMPAEPKARRMLVISDGHDEGSVHRLSQVIAAARSGGVIIDAIGITRSQAVYLNNLRQLAASTGGLFREAMSTADMEHLVGSGIQRIKSIPVATFVAADANADGHPHQFKVTWMHRRRAASDTFSSILPVISPGANDTAETGKLKIPVWWATCGGLLVVLLALALFLLRRRKAAPAVPVYAGPGFTPAPQAVQRSANAQYDTARSPTVAVNTNQPSVTYSAGAQSLNPAVAPKAAPVRPSTQVAARFSKPTKERPTAWLIGESGPEAGKTVAIDECEFWIGALENNSMRIASDPTVSGNHACIVFDHELLGIWDHHSTNGTRINDEVVGDTKRLLRPGDRIRIGRSTFLLRPNENQLQ